jgi:hypothetical protein
MIDRVYHRDSLLAIIIRSEYCTDGIEFFTPGEFSQQLAYMNRPAGYRIDSHLHNKVQRRIADTQEVLFIKKGKVKAYFYGEDKEPVETKVLRTGDVIMLASGGHGFEMLEKTEIIEVKQGPYVGADEKERFEP